MSWDQGVQDRTELPAKFIEKMEAEFEKRFGYHKKLKYITWFGLGREVFLDFDDENGLKLDYSKMKKDEPC